MRPFTSDVMRAGRLEIRRRERKVLLDGQAVTLGGRAFDVLLILTEQAGQVVDQRELFDRVWGGMTVEPNNLQVQIWTLRRLLGREAVVTVPRRGYTLVLGDADGNPEDESADDAASARDEVVMSGVGGGEDDRRRLRWRPRAG